MNFNNVCKAIKASSKDSFSPKTIIRGYTHGYDAAEVLTQFNSVMQSIVLTSIKPEIPNIQAAGASVGYLISLYSVLSKNTKSPNEVFEAFWGRTERVLLSKGKEYANGQNRFQNFDTAALEAHRVGEMEATPVSCGWAMARKHQVSCQDQIMALVPSLKSPRKAEDMKKITAVLDEKIGDLVNYILLVEGCMLRDE